MFVKGLCGTFNGNQKDDFLTPEGDVEQDPAAFANKWKTKEVCDNVENTASSHPCEQHVQNRAAAERHCANITSSLFAGYYSTLGFILYINILYKTYKESCLQSPLKVHKCNLFFPKCSKLNHDYRHSIMMPSSKRSNLRALEIKSMALLMGPDFCWICNTTGNRIK